MNSIVSVIEKKDFLRWFLNKYQLKRRECTWLLNYLLSDDTIMERVHFVEQAELCPKALIISSTCVEDIPFCFYKDKHVIMDAEKAFHDIRLNLEEDVYIQFNFLGAMTHPKYVSVLEDNPFIPINKESAMVDELIAEMFLDKVLLEHQKKQLLVEIDQALDDGDEERFAELTKQLLAKNL